MAANRFRLSKYRLLTGDMGLFYPTGLWEGLPGDVFQHSSTCMVRLSPMAAPVMHPIVVKQLCFFIPHRLSWPDGYATTWEDFITGGPSGNESNPLPTLDLTGTKNDLLDYLGLPQVAGGHPVSSLPIRAFNLVWNEWMRDQDLEAARSLEALDIPHVAWEKDYHTVARPWPQKGDDVTVPLGTAAPVVGLGTINQNVSDNATVYETGQSSTKTYSKYATNTSDLRVQMTEDAGNAYPSIFADLSNAAAAKVNEIRRAFALQRFQENRARWGSRYTEYVRRAFKTRPLDMRLQRPEYLGGSAQAINISEVLQTAPDGASPRFGVSDLYGHGIAAGRSQRYRVKLREHGYVMSFIFVRPKQVFTQGIERHWLRRDREDFYQHELAHIGQQQIMQPELYADGTNKETVFGYSDRYQEYRFARSLAVGEFRDELDYWHLGRKFASAPTLNADFIRCNPSKRIFNEQTRHSLWMAVNHSVIARRRVVRSAEGKII